MRLTKLMLFFGAVGIAIASAANYKVTVSEPIVVNGMEFKRGEVQLELNGDKAMLRAGKQSVEAPVKVETASEKYRTTTVRWADRGGKHVIQEIRLGGTTTRVIFEN